MLAILGHTDHAVATAALAAATSGQEVAIDPGPRRTALSSTLTDNPIAVLPGGRQQPVRLSIKRHPAAEAYLWFATPGDLHQASPGSLRFGSAPVLYAPATFAGCDALVRLRGSDLADRTGVLSGFPAIGDVSAGRVTIRGVKDQLPCGGRDRATASDLARVFGGWLPGLRSQRALETELNSNNTVAHGPLLLGHLAQLSDPQGEPALFYRGPAFRAAAPLVTAIDLERRRLGSSLGLELPAVEELLLGYYGSQGMSGTTFIELHESFKGLAASRAPARFDHRYLTDDVTFGLACWEALAALRGVATPTISAVVTVLETVSGIRLRNWAPDLAARVHAGHSEVAQLP